MHSPRNRLKKQLDPTVFSYIDDKAMRRLENLGKRFCIDESGALAHPQGAQRNNLKIINMLGPVPLPLTHNNTPYRFDWYAFVPQPEMAGLLEKIEMVKHDGLKDLWPLLNTYISVNSALAYANGGPWPMHNSRSPVSHSERPTLVRIHSSCQTGDVFGSRRCDCGPQFDVALRKIIENRHGLLLYLASHEGRGIGLYAKAMTYLLQDSGLDTYEANVQLGLPKDSRDFSICAAVIKYLAGGDTPITLLTNNPDKVNQMRANSVAVTSVSPLVTGITAENRRYIHAKKRFGHTFLESDITVQLQERRAHGT